MEHDWWMKTSHQRRYTDGRPKKRRSTSLAIGEVQVKPTMRFHYIPIIRAKIKNSDNTKGWWECGETDCPSAAAGNVKWPSHAGKQLGDFLKKLKGNPAIAFRAVLPEKWRVRFTQNLYSNIYSIIIRNSHKRETTQVFSSGWTIKQATAYPDHGPVHGHRRSRLPSCVTAWVGLRTTLSERGQPQHIHAAWSHSYKLSRGQRWRLASRWVVARG